MLTRISGSSIEAAGVAAARSSSSSPRYTFAVALELSSTLYRGPSFAPTSRRRGDRAETAGRGEVRTQQQQRHSLTSIPQHQASRPRLTAVCCLLMGCPHPALWLPGSRIFSARFSPICPMTNAPSETSNVCSV